MTKKTAITNKKYWYISLILLVSAVTYIYLNVNKPPIEHKKNISLNVNPSSIAPEATSPSPNKNEKKIQSPVVKNLDQPSRAEVTRWFASKGYFDIYGLDDQNDYKNYDEATLEKLAKDGDIHAIHELAVKQEHLDKRRNLFYGAAVHGSTAAIMDIGTSIWVEANLDEKSEEEKKGVILESLSFYHAAYLRGDSWALLNAGSSLLALHPTNLSQSDVEQIKRRGSEVYTEIQNNRNQLNLGVFDNSTPAAVKLFIEDYRHQTKSNTDNLYFKSIFND